MKKVYYNDTEDLHLLEKFKSGDKALFKSIYLKHAVLLIKFAQGFLKKREDVEDVIGDVFEKLWRKKLSFDGMHQIKAWLYITTRNECLNKLKSLQHRMEGSPVPFDEDAFNQANIAEESRRLELKGLVLQEIYDLANKLPEKCKEVFILAYKEGFTNDDIAELLQITPRTVKNQKQIAVKKIRQGLDVLKLLLSLSLFLNCL